MLLFDMVTFTIGNCSIVILCSARHIQRLADELDEVSDGTRRPGGCVSSRAFVSVGENGGKVYGLGLG